MPLLDAMIYGYRQILAAGVELTRRSKVNFGAGLLAVDNPTTGCTDVTAPGGGGVAAPVAISAYEIDWEAGDVFYKVLGAGAQAFTFANATDGQVIIVEVTGAASTLTWPTTKWAGGVPPTQTASGTDIYTFVKRGSAVYGSVVQDMA